jgi:Ca2+/Na+ antiporter
VRAADPVRAGRALGGAAAAILVLEGIAVLFVPRAIAPTEGLGAVRLTILLVLALLLVLAAGVQRRERGLVIGTALQVPLLLTGLMTTAMWFVGGAFVLIWLYLLQVRKELIGSPFGPVPVPGTDGTDHTPG